MDSMVDMEYFLFFLLGAPFLLHVNILHCKKNMVVCLLCFVFPSHFGDDSANQNGNGSMAMEALK